MKYLLLCACFITTFAFADVISDTNGNGSLSSGLIVDGNGSNSTETIDSNANGSQSAYNVHKKFLVAAKPDAMYVLEGIGSISTLSRSRGDYRTPKRYRLGSKPRVNL